MQDCVLVTGGAGFIGCAMSDGLLRFGLPIVAVDVLAPQVHPAQTRPGRLPSHVELIVGDVADAALWNAFLQDWRPQIVVHLAAETGTGQSLTEASLHAGANVVGTTRMLDAFARADITPQQFLLSSSRAVYGDGAWMDASNTVFYPMPRTKDAMARAEWGFKSPEGADLRPLPHRAGHTAPAPTSVYGATKLAQEHILTSWCAAMGAALSILRFQNVYGPGQAPDNAYTGIINIFHKVANAGGVIDVYEDGDIGRDFVFIDDVVRACLAALEQRPARGQRTLDVGTGDVTTVRAAAQIIAAHLDAPEPKVTGNFRPGDVRWAVADASDLAAELGVKASVGFKDGLAQTSEWLLSQAAQSHV